MLDEENPSEAEIEEHQPDPACTLEDEQRKLEDLHDAPDVAHESNDQEYIDPIEHWFQMTVSIHTSLIIQRFVASHQLMQLVPHVLVFSRICFSNLNMNMIILLLRTWLHWKSSYT